MDQSQNNILSRLKIIKYEEFDSDRLNEIFGELSELLHDDRLSSLEIHNIFDCIIIENLLTFLTDIQDFTEENEIIEIFLNFINGNKTPRRACFHFYLFIFHYL
jgi:hypothetical protein